MSEERTVSNVKAIEEGVRVLTTTSLRQLGQSQTREICGNRLESDITVPLIGGLLFLAESSIRVSAVDFGKQFGTDGADLLIGIAVLAHIALAVQHRVDVQAGRFGAAGELAEAEDELLLQVVGEVVLFAEPDDATLADCNCLLVGARAWLEEWPTCQGQLGEKFISVVGVDHLGEIGGRKFTSDTRR